ncbi:MAG: hypothetical protein GY824_22640, partial [Delftia sp.]|nr:hypothetical protein [Delftia sp.]
MAYLDDELSAEERARIEAHLATCESCAQELEMLRGLQAGLAATLPAALGQLTLPAPAQARIRRRLRQEQERGAWWERVWRLLGLGRGVWRRRVALSYVALTLLVVLFGVNAWQSSRIAETSDQQETLVLARREFAPGSLAA